MTARPIATAPVRRFLILAIGLAMAGTVIDGGAREAMGGHRFGGARAAARGPAQRQPRAPEPAATPVVVQPEPVAAPRPARPGRLTPDERRALRQQINDAGRDIYRPARP